MANYSHSLRFYADTNRGQVNKLFEFQVNPVWVDKAIKRFELKGFHIRAAWLITKDETGKETQMKINDLFS